MTTVESQTDPSAVKRSAALLVRLGDRGAIEVGGPDAVEFLQGQVTNDVAALQPGHGCYAALLDPKAHMLADMRVLMPEPGRLLIDTEPQALEAVLQNLRTYKIGRQVEITDRSDELTTFALVGDDSSALLPETGASAPAADREHDCVQATVGGAQALIVTTPFGYDVTISEADANRALAALQQVGFSEAPFERLELARIEAGRPRYGVDMGIDNLPGEAGIVERGVSFEKGCYVGQEPVARMFHKGRPNRHLRGLQFDQPVTAGAPLRVGDREVGRATSTVISPHLGPIGLAIVRREVEPGDTVNVEGSTARATVVELPFDR